MDDGTVEGGFANANCDAFDAGAVSIDAYAWSSAPRDAMLRVGVEARADRGARETYASVLIANDVDREVNLNGVTIQYEFSISARGWKRDDFYDDASFRGRF